VKQKLKAALSAAAFLVRGCFVKEGVLDAKEYFF
jgi:hypothetical protein